MAVESLLHPEPACEVHPSDPSIRVERARASLAGIAAEVAELYGLSVSELRARTRRHDISHPRQHAMALMRAQTRPDGSPRYSCQQIANYFGAKDHTTVAYGVRAHLRRAGQADQ